MLLVEKGGPLEVIEKTQHTLDFAFTIDKCHLHAQGCNPVLRCDMRLSLSARSPWHESLLDMNAPSPCIATSSIQLDMPY